jgi:hypothetical protein
MIWYQDPALRAIIQEGLLERYFLDALFPNLIFRDLCTPEPWTERAQQVVKTRAGLLPPMLTPLTPTQDPNAQTYDFEQWLAEIEAHGSACDVDVRVSGLALADLFKRTTQTLGMQAGQSVNRLARQAIVNAALYGQTIATDNESSNKVKVARLNGFAEVYDPTAKRFVSVSASNPLPAFVWQDSQWKAISIVGVEPDITGDIYGPGELVMADDDVTIASGDPIIASTASEIYWVGGGHSINDISGLDVLGLNSVIAAVARLRAKNVPTWPDGLYHVHLDPVAEAELLSDDKVIALFRGTKFESEEYSSAVIGVAMGCKFFRNTECPNAGTLPPEFGANGDKCVALPANGDGVGLHYTIITGADACIEYYKDEAVAATEAGVTGKLGNWFVTNNAIEVNAQRIQMIMRAPLDRFQRTVSLAWHFMGAHVPAQDYLATGKAYADLPDPSGGQSRSRYKRIIAVVHA